MGRLAQAIKTGRHRFSGAPSDHAEHRDPKLTADFRAARVPRACRMRKPRSEAHTGEAGDPQATRSHPLEINMKRGALMVNSKLAGICASWLLAAAAAHAQGGAFANGNMKMDVSAMDANGDTMISKDEFMQYGEKMWHMMSKGSGTISVSEASQDFARGNMRFSAKAMDTDHDGTISKDEFMTYGGKKFDKVKDGQGMVSVADATKYFANGNMHTDKAAKSP
jgi:EF hand